MLVAVDRLSRRRCTAADPRLLLFSINMRDRRGNALLVTGIDLLRNAVRRRSQPFASEAWMVLLDHLHAVST